MDHFKNISGYAPGKLASLNINGEFFIGGHENFNFTGKYFDLVVKCNGNGSDIDYKRIIS